MSVVLKLAHTVYAIAFLRGCGDACLRACVRACVHSSTKRCHEDELVEFQSIRANLRVLNQTWLLQRLLGPV